MVLSSSCKPHNGKTTSSSSTPRCMCVVLRIRASSPKPPPPGGRTEMMFTRRVSMCMMYVAGRILRRNNFETDNNEVALPPCNTHQAQAAQQEG